MCPYEFRREKKLFSTDRLQPLVLPRAEDSLCSVACEAHKPQPDSERIPDPLEALFGREMFDKSVAFGNRQDIRGMVHWCTGLIPLLSLPPQHADLQ